MGFKAFFKEFVGNGLVGARGEGVNTLPPCQIIFVRKITIDSKNANTQQLHMLPATQATKFSDDKALHEKRSKSPFCILRQLFQSVFARAPIRSSWNIFLLKSISNGSFGSRKCCEGHRAIESLRAREANLCAKKV